MLLLPGSDQQREPVRCTEDMASDPPALQFREIREFWWEGVEGEEADVWRCEAEVGETTGGEQTARAT